MTDAAAGRAAGGGARLRTLHVPGAPPVLPNAWDAASARTAAGFPVVAAGSAAVAAALG